MESFSHDKIFFTSDLHAFHGNIIKHCNRPFTSVEEMNKHFISQWNSVVPKDGIVINCGDVAMKIGSQTLQRFLEQLNGSHILILGNHDRINKIPKDCFTGIHEQLIFTVTGDEDMPNKIIHACHYPMLSWYQIRRGAFHIYGHTHQNDTLNTHEELILKMGENCLNVGVDNCKFKPLSWSDLKNKMIQHNRLFEK
jgi:Predicted phosphoesterase or phosphohydrolase